MGDQFDDDTTPPRGSESTDSERHRKTRRGSAWGDPERSAVGLTHRRTPTPPARSIHELEDVTPVFDLVTPDDDPVTGAQFREAFEKLAGSLGRLRRDSKSGPDPAVLSGIASLRKELDDLRDATETHAPALRDTARDMRLIKWVAGVAITFALGSVLTVLFRLLDRAEHEGETAIRLDHVEENVKELLHESRHPPWLLPPPK